MAWRLRARLHQPTAAGARPRLSSCARALARWQLDGATAACTWGLVCVCSPPGCSAAAARSVASAPLRRGFFAASLPPFSPSLLSRWLKMSADAKISRLNIPHAALVVRSPAGRHTQLVIPAPGQLGRGRRRPEVLDRTVNTSPPL